MKQELITTLTDSRIKQTILNKNVSISESPFETTTLRAKVSYLNESIISMDIVYNSRYFNGLSEQGKQLVMLHEYLHITLYSEGVKESNLHHPAFPNDPDWNKGIRDIYPGESPEFYENMKYQGCDDLLDQMVNDGRMTGGQRDKIKTFNQAQIR